MATNRGDKNEGGSNSSRELVGLATSMGFGLLIFIGGGVLLDNLFKTSPIFLLVGFFFALASVVVFLWKIVQAGGKK
jgi:F0F1-type ATP synthase assembly protein I